MRRTQSVLIRLLVLLVTLSSFSIAAVSGKTTRKKRSAHGVATKVPARTVAYAVAGRPAAAKAKPAATKKATTSGPWRSPDYADSTDGDYIDGDDLVARRAAVEALGRLNGTVVVADPYSGRILTVVNQKIAFKSGFQPCSTVKVPVALAALSESVVDRTTLIRIYGRTSLALTEALAKSNNQYFASLGEKLGFERMSYYAHLFGLGEKASLDIDAEQPGILPSETPRSGMGMMTSFGDGIALTPLEYAALIGAVANGGTLYYLQYPKSQADAQTLVPRIKRRLDIAEIIPEIKPGMMGAVEYGTARRIGFDPNEPIYGKTGTCTDSRTPTHLGWFGSFTEAGNRKLVVVVLLTGGKAVSGPAAAGVAGQVYKNLDAANYFAQQPQPLSPVALIEGH